MIGMFVFHTKVDLPHLLFVFRSVRATLIPCWSCFLVLGLGYLGLMGYEITVLTALIPPLIIIIGVPNCIFLINKYAKVAKHGNQIKSLQQVIVKIGNATCEPFHYGIGVCDLYLDQQ